MFDSDTTPALAPSMPAVLVEKRPQFDADTPTLDH
jgi:hypothetical protein